MKFAVVIRDIHGLEDYLRPTTTIQRVIRDIHGLEDELLTALKAVTVICNITAWKSEHGSQRIKYWRYP